MPSCIKIIYQKSTSKTNKVFITLSTCNRLEHKKCIPSLRLELPSHFTRGTKTTTWPTPFLHLSYMDNLCPENTRATMDMENVGGSPKTSTALIHHMYHVFRRVTVHNFIPFYWERVICAVPSNLPLSEKKYGGCRLSHYYGPAA